VSPMGPDEIVEERSFAPPTLMDDEMSEYRRHLEQLLEPRRRKVRADARRAAIGCVALVAAMIMISSGMPGHRFAHWLGVPLAIAFAICFALFLFTSASILWDQITRKS
jgi:hypothetical protein